MWGLPLPLQPCHHHHHHSLSYNLSCCVAFYSLSSSPQPLVSHVIVPIFQHDNSRPVSSTYYRDECRLPHSNDNSLPPLCYSPSNLLRGVLPQAVVVYSWQHHSNSRMMMIRWRQVEQQQRLDLDGKSGTGGRVLLIIITVLYRHPCDLCKCVLYSMEELSNHINGKRHQKALRNRNWMKAQEVK